MTTRECSACAGTGTPVSGRPCICGGVGTQSAELQGLRELAYQLRNGAVTISTAVLSAFGKAPMACDGMLLVSVEGYAEIVDALNNIEGIV